MSDFSEKLKAARIQRGYSVKEAAERMRDAGLTISEKTLYNWESGTRTPDADAFMKICEVYKIESFEQFDGMIDKQTQKEAEILRKYRRLDDDGQARVLNTLEFEYEQIKAKDKTDSAAS